MSLYHWRSIIIVLIYFAFNLGIIVLSFSGPKLESSITLDHGSKLSDNSEISNLEYFNLKDKNKKISLVADFMSTKDDEFMFFKNPKGIFFTSNNLVPINYQAEIGHYFKKKNQLKLLKNVEVKNEESSYFAQEMQYLINKDLLIGKGEIRFVGVDLKSGDTLTINSNDMKAKPLKKSADFKGSVNGQIQRKRKFEGKTEFQAQELSINGFESLVHLQGEVSIRRENYVINSGEADIYLENFNKKLKYFVLNDDVKVSEKIETPKGVIFRKSFSERLEGFTKEEKMILSGAPRVETGNDVIKGYKITIREKSELVEVEDAISDVEVKRTKND